MESIQQLLGLVSEFSKIAGYKISKLILFLYSSNEQTENEIKKKCHWSAWVAQLVERLP